MLKNPLSNAGDARNASLIPGLGRSTGGGDGNPLLSGVFLHGKFHG